MARKPATPSQRPTESICARLAQGESLRSICRDEGMPHHSTVLMWARDDADFANQYARARDIGVDVEFDGLEELSDAEPERDDKGKVDPGWVQYQKLRIDTRKWTLARKAPKKYGDKLETTLKGDPTAPVALTLNGSDIHG